MLISKATKDFLAYVEVTKAPGTLRHDKEKLTTLSKFFNNREIESLSRTDLILFVQSKKGTGVGNRSINKYVGTLNKMLKYHGVPPIEFEKLKEQQKQIPTIDKDIINLIFDFHEKRINNKHRFRNLIFYKVLLETGVRFNEVIHIEYANINFDENSILLTTTKTKNDRYVFFTETTAMLLQEFIKFHKLDKWLFINFETREKLHYEGIQAILKRLKRRLDINESISPHKWRHTFATNFVRRGGNIETLRQILGHSDISTTQIYMHLSLEDNLAEYQKIMSTTV